MTIRHAVVMHLVEGKQIDHIFSIVVEKLLRHVTTKSPRGQTPYKKGLHLGLPFKTAVGIFTSPIKLTW